MTPGRLGTVRRISGPDAVANAIAFARYSDGSFGWNVVDPGHGLVFANQQRPLDAAAGAPLSASGKYGPTIFYLHDSLQLAKEPVTDWPAYVFWAPIKGGLTSDALPAALAGYNTYTSKGLPPGPLCTPTTTSIDAALEPDTSDGYLYFIAKGDGTGTSAFAKTAKEHAANVKKYLKQ